MKLIDWSRAPRGTMTNYGELLGISNTGKGQMLGRFNSKFDWELVSVDLSALRIVPQTRWAYHDCGPCPVPFGLRFQVQLRSGLLMGIGELHALNHSWRTGPALFDIIAYRITGVDRAGGWTDDPSEVTE